MAITSFCQLLNKHHMSQLARQADVMNKMACHWPWECLGTYA